MSEQSVLTKVDGNVLIVTINRPSRKNAVDPATAAVLEQVFVDFDRNESLNVAILTGAEESFCAGADLKAVAGIDGQVVDSAAALDSLSLGPMGPTNMLLTKPVIAAVEGFAVAGGLELAMWCDMRVAAQDACFGVFCRRWGVPLIDGGTIRLSRALGHSHALDMILTGREVSGAEAQSMGLANRLVAPGTALLEAKKLAKQIAAFPQCCLRADRLSSYQQWGMDLDPALQNEFDDGVVVIQSGETVAGAKRFSAGAGRHGKFEE